MLPVLCFFFLFFSLFPVLRCVSFPPLPFIPLCSVRSLTMTSIVREVDNPHQFFMSSLPFCLVLSSHLSLFSVPFSSRHTVCSIRDFLISVTGFPLPSSLFRFFFLLPLSSWCSLRFRVLWTNVSNMCCLSPLLLRSRASLQLAPLFFLNRAVTCHLFNILLTLLQPPLRSQPSLPSFSLSLISCGVSV